MQYYRWSAVLSLLVLSSGSGLGAELALSPADLVQIVEAQHALWGPYEANGTLAQRTDDAAAPVATTRFVFRRSGDRQYAELITTSRDRESRREVIAIGPQLFKKLTLRDGAATGLQAPAVTAGSLNLTALMDPVRYVWQSSGAPWSRIDSQKMGRLVVEIKGGVYQLTHIIADRRLATVWVDPSRGFSVIRSVTWDARGDASVDTTVEELIRHDKGPWIPARTRSRFRDEQGRLRHQEIVFADVHLNARLEPDALSFEFPAGAEYWDASAQRMYRVGPDDLAQPFTR